MGARSSKPKPRDTIDFLKLRGLIRDAARRAFGELRDGQPGESFYGFALYTDDGAMTIMPAANTEEGYRRKVEAYKYTEAQEMAYVRWATAEWAYEAAGEAHFEAAHDLLNGPGRDDGEDDRRFIHFLGKLIETMVGALKDLDGEGFFGKGDARNNVTLFVTISDSDLSEAVEERSSRELNPPAVHKAFMKR